MGRPKKGTEANPIVIDADKLSAIADSLADMVKKPFEINDAAIKDGFCNYGYEVSTGKAIGTIHNIKGKLIIEDDLRDAFVKFNVHAAVIDDAFRRSNIQISDIDTMHNDNIALDYHVVKVVIKGKEENAGVVLIGDKRISLGSRMSFETPKILVDSSSSYTWYNELRAAMEVLIKEVELYDGGKGTAVRVEDEEPKLKQTKMVFDQPSAAENELDSDFENAEI